MGLGGGGPQLGQASNLYNNLGSLGGLAQGFGVNALNQFYTPYTTPYLNAVNTAGNAAQNIATNGFTALQKNVMMGNIGGDFTNPFLTQYNNGLAALGQRGFSGASAGGPNSIGAGLGGYLQTQQQNNLQRAQAGVGQQMVNAPIQYGQMAASMYQPVLGMGASNYMSGLEHAGSMYGDAAGGLMNVYNTQQQANSALGQGLGSLIGAGINAWG